MDTKKITLLLIAGIVVVALLAAVMLFFSKNSKMSREPIGSPTPTKEVEFVVIRVLPSGFSPSEVTIKKGMIVRFTNPIENKVQIKWEGTTQYTKELVFEGNDIATTVFDTEGIYTFTDDAAKPHMGKVVVR